MSDFDPGKHPRSKDGKFKQRRYPEAAGGTSALADLLDVEMPERDIPAEQVEAAHAQLRTLPAYSEAVVEFVDGRQMRLMARGRPETDDQMDRRFTSVDLGSDLYIPASPDGPTKVARVLEPDRPATVDLDAELRDPTDASLAEDFEYAAVRELVLDLQNTDGRQEEDGWDERSRVLAGLERLRRELAVADDVDADLADDTSTEGPEQRAIKAWTSNRELLTGVPISDTDIANLDRHLDETWRQLGGQTGCDLCGSVVSGKGAYRAADGDDAVCGSCRDDTQ